MAAFRRVDRVNQLLREELSRLIRHEMKDPRVRGVTVTGVETTSDLAHATVHVRTLRDDQPVDEAIEGLESAGGWLRRTLGRDLHMRRIPEFAFEEDRTLEKARRIEELLEQAGVGREEGVDEGGDGPEEPDDGESGGAGD